MDGTKRRANGQPVRRDSATVDLGITPPWAPPLVYHAESALRYTQSSPEPTVNPSALHRSATVPAWASLSHPPQHLPAPQSRKRTEKKRAMPVASLLTVTGDYEIEDDDDDGGREVVLHVDTDNDRDRVYHINADKGTWSSPFPEEDNDPEAQANVPDQAIIALEHLKQAQDLAEQQRALSNQEIARLALAHDPDAGGVPVRDSERWHEDLLLRNVIRRIKHKLRAGTTLTLERLPGAAAQLNLTITCAHPQCPASNHKIPPGAYYVILGQPREMESAEQFCLFCLEDMWNGKGIQRPLPSPKVGPRQVKEVNAVKEVGSTGKKVGSFNLDGAMDDERLRAAGLQTDGSVTTTPRSQSTATDQSTTATPGTIYSVATSPKSSAVASPLQHKTTNNPAVRISTEDECPESKEAYVGDVKVAKKRGVEQPKLSSREARDLVLGFGEKFLNGQLNIRMNRGDVDIHPAGRRSTRLQSVAGDDSRERERSETVKSESVRTQPTQQPINRTRRPAATEAVADEVAKAEKRLGEMYLQREIALSSLKPGESAVIRHPRAPRSAAKHTVSLDMFDVPFTSLLAPDHVNYYAKPAVSEAAPAERPERTLHGPNATKLPLFGHRKYAPQMLHCGICYEVAERSEGVKCANERCLQGVYHAACVLGADALPEGWLCRYCKGFETVTLPALLKKADVEQLFSPPYAQERYIMAQMDGPADLPACLLSSRHAPSQSELGELVEGDEHPITPGGPYSPSSTYSSGEWKDPPTRSQYLASFFRAGNSLNEKEKAATEVWKASSREQLEWEKHLRRAQILREVYAEMMNENIKNVGSPRLALEEKKRSERIEDRSDVDVEAAEKIAGVMQEDCRGKDLSGVLAEVRSRDGE